MRCALLDKRKHLAVHLCVMLLLTTLSVPWSAYANGSTDNNVRVVINKYGYEIADGREVITEDNLPGAKLRILDSNGNRVYPQDAEYFTTTGEPLEIELPAGDYSLEEIEAPKGYERTDEAVSFSAAGTSSRIFSENETYTGIDEGDRGMVYGIHNLAVYHGTDKYVAACIMPGIDAPPVSPGSATYHYVDETRYTNLSALQIARIKKIISLYEGKDETLLGKLKNREGPQNVDAALYIAAEVAISRIVNFNSRFASAVHNEGYTGNLPEAVNYLVAEAKKITAADDLEDALKEKQIAIFQTQKCYQHLVILELFEGCAKVSIGNQKIPEDTGSVGVRIKKYGYELSGGREVVVAEHLAGAKLQVQDLEGKKVYPSGSAECFVTTDSALSISLDPGEYKLVEIEAPEGYIKTDDPIYFTVRGPRPVGIDAGASYTGMQEGLRDGIYLAYNFAVYLNDRSLGAAVCVQPGKTNPGSKPGNSGYEYVRETDYDALTDLHKARIKKLVDMYASENDAAVAALKTGCRLNDTYKQSSIYSAVFAAIGEMIQPGYINSANLPKNNSSGNVPAAARYYANEAKKINGMSDLSADLRTKELAFFATDSNRQDLVLMQLFDVISDSEEVEIGNKRHVTTGYTVKYLDEDYNEILPDKVVNGVEIGAEITETAVYVEGYRSVEPVTLTKIMKPEGNVFEFVYKSRDDY